jgi:MtfA peptidase
MPDTTYNIDGFRETTTESLLKDTTAILIGDINDGIKYKQNRESEIPIWLIIFVIGLCILTVVGLFQAIKLRIKYEWNVLKYGKGYSQQISTPIPTNSSNNFIYAGSTLDFTQEEIDAILQKRFQYYRLLDDDLKQVFCKRVLEFMQSKYFNIVSNNPFKEMPVLLSAAAMQLSFGLQKFMLPHYNVIRIHQEEYFSSDGLRVLAGNVQGNTISLAWNQFLKGYENNKDGSNVGLHEMAHALYFQHMVANQKQKLFTKHYNELVAECHQAFEDETKGKKNLYSDYAVKDLQEFWAESVELFFEKPFELKLMYPDVFDAMKLLLNQNPMQPNNPLLQSNLSLPEKLLQLFTTSKFKRWFGV